MLSSERQYYKWCVCVCAYVRACVRACVREFRAVAIIYNEAVSYTHLTLPTNHRV